MFYFVVARRRVTARPLRRIGFECPMDRTDTDMVPGDIEMRRTFTFQIP
jgi:hypothetical protein